MGAFAHCSLNRVTFSDPFLLPNIQRTPGDHFPSDQLPQATPRSVSQETRAAEVRSTEVYLRWPSWCREPDGS